jgi:hypothetical protein
MIQAARCSYLISLRQRLGPSASYQGQRTEESAFEQQRIPSGLTQTCKCVYDKKIQEIFGASQYTAIGRFSLFSDKVTAYQQLPIFICIGFVLETYDRLKHLQLQC